MQGSLQLYVETSIDLLVNGEYQKFLKQVDDTDLINLKIFYFVFGQWDSGAHNMLAYQNGNKVYPIAIDNSAIRNHQYVKYGQLPFVRTIYSDKLNTNDWHQPFPFENAKTIENLTTQNLKLVFGNKLPESFYQNFNSYNQPYRYVTYQNSIFRQYHVFEQEFIKSYATSSCPKKTAEAPRKLDLKALKNIYSTAKGADFLTERYLNNILERRDQLLASVRIND